MCVVDDFVDGLPFLLPFQLRQLHLISFFPLLYFKGSPKRAWAGGRG